VPRFWLARLLISVLRVRNSVPAPFNSVGPVHLPRVGPKPTLGPKDHLGPEGRVGSGDPLRMAAHRK
jgi:hypothetical protein